MTRGENIDETNTRVEEWIDSLGQSTDTRGPPTANLTAEQKETEINRFKTAEMRYGLKYLLLRALEISTNEGLGMDNCKLIEYVRQLEKNKKQRIELSTQTQETITNTQEQAITTKESHMRPTKHYSHQWNSTV